MIIAFTKDWNDVPTCTTHVLREMARTRPVLWVNSIGTRKPQLAQPGHLGRVVQRVLQGFRPAVYKENNLRVLSPLLVPKAQSRFAVQLNRCLMAAYIRRERKRWGDDESLEYWCFIPNAVDLLPHKATCHGSVPRDTRHPTPDTRHLVAYYCVDDWSKFHNLDCEWLRAKEQELLQRADAVFTPARYLAEKCRRIIMSTRDAADTAAATGREEECDSSCSSELAARIYHVPHGVEYAKFRAALSADTLVPAEIDDLPAPVIGFYGNIYPWIDFDLVSALALRKKDWSFVLIGQEFCDVSVLKVLPNVHFPGRREHSELPACCAGFSAAMIPYDVKNPRMESVNPVKTRELLAAGVPVVGADIPELHGFGDRVRVCRTVDEWVSALEQQVVRTDRDAISRSVADDDWSSRVRSIREIVDQVGSG